MYSPSFDTNWDALQREVYGEVRIACACHLAMAHVGGMGVILQDSPGGSPVESAPLLEITSRLFRHFYQSDSISPSLLVAGLGPKTRSLIHDYFRRVVDFHEERWAVSLKKFVDMWCVDNDVQRATSMLFLALCLRTVNIMEELDRVVLSTSHARAQLDFYKSQTEVIQLARNTASKAWHDRRTLVSTMTPYAWSQFDVSAQRYTDDFVGAWRYAVEALSASIYWIYYVRPADEGGVAQSD